MYTYMQNTARANSRNDVNTQAFYLSSIWRNTNSGPIRTLLIDTDAPNLNKKNTVSEVQYMHPS